MTSGNIRKTITVSHSLQSGLAELIIIIIIIGIYIAPFPFIKCPKALGGLLVVFVLPVTVLTATKSAGPGNFLLVLL